MTQCNHTKDRISNLPDEILIAILSLLSLKEAGRTCALSKRWTNLWKFTSEIDFDYDGIGFVEFYTYRGRFKTKLAMKRDSYISWVDQVLKLHRGSTISKFRLGHDFDKSFGCMIDRWIEFAAKKQVQKLELDLSDSSGEPRFFGAYAFPKSILESIGFAAFSNLISLSLIEVDLTDESISYFLTTCIFLERLTINSSHSLKKIIINGPPSLKLKYLEIESYTLRHIEISTINLIVLKYKGHDLRMMSLTNVPALVEFSIGGPYTQHLIVECIKLPPWFSQLQKLVISMDYYYSANEKSLLYLKSFPEFGKLRHLELDARVDRNERLRFLDSLVQASRQLQKLVIKLLHNDEARERTETMEEILEEERIWSVEELEIVEFIGWRGYKGDTSYVLYLSDHAPHLSKVIIDPRHPTLMGTIRFDWKQEEMKEEMARRRAQLLKHQLPPNVELLVL